MKAATQIVVLLVVLSASISLSATAQEEQGAAERSEAAAQARDAREAPAVQAGHRRGQAATAPAPKTKPPLRRRSVQQVIATVPPPQLAGPSYGPTLAPRAPAPVGAPAPGAAPVYPPPPAAINGCQGGVCTDATGTSYNLGTGNAGVSSQGKLCSRTGQTVQCF